MLNEKTIKQLITTPAFLGNCNKLAHELHIPRRDSSQELLMELLDHRLRTWSDKDVTIAITKDLPSLKWKVKYARKDIVRKQSKSASIELEKASMVAHMEPLENNPDGALEALERLPELFKNTNTRNWCESILRVGQKETMVRFSQTHRQFNNKLAKVCKYARQHQQPKQRSHAKELKLLKEWDDLMADQQTSDNGIQLFIDQHKEYIENIIDDPQVAYQGRLIKDFANAGKDKYVLVNLMAKKLEQEKLKEKDKNELS